MQKTSNIHIRVDAKMKNWLNILEQKYHINKSHFIRDAILEKFKRDTPKIKLEYKREKLPF